MSFAQTIGATRHAFDGLKVLLASGPMPEMAAAARAGWLLRAAKALGAAGIAPKEGMPGGALAAP